VAGSLRSSNETVPLALDKLGYPENSIKVILSYISERGTIEGAPIFGTSSEEEKAVFDTAFRPANGTPLHSLHWAHQDDGGGTAIPIRLYRRPVNLPTEATPDDILKTYVEGWKLGLKSIAIYYRDGSKSNQPMVTSHVSAATPDEALTTIISQRELSAPSSELLTAVDKQFGV